MATAKLITIKVSEERREALHKLADSFGESLSLFLLKSAFERAERAVPGAAEDPFVAQMRRVAAKGALLSSKERGQVQRARHAAATGGQMSTVAQARAAVKAW